MNHNDAAINIKKEVLVKLIKAFYSDNFKENVRLIPFEMREKSYKVPFRCCIYKEREILRDRIIAGLGLSVEEDNDRVLLPEYVQKAMEREKLEENPLTVVDIACNGCVPNRIFVTDICQGCVARSCQQACNFGAISIMNGRSSIDSTKCKHCKLCISACPYSAIVKVAVPCEDACPVGAIAKDDSGHAVIDFDSCITCGRCVAGCPFGAVHEKSQLIDILKKIRAGDKVVAMLAPAIAGQFQGSIYQLKTAILKLGFSDVYEVAEGADITTRNEAEEFEERMAEGAEFMTTSCCAGYNQFIAKHFPEIKPYVSSTKTPMYYIAEKVKKDIPGAFTVFVSPCVAKRKEGQCDDNVDFVMSFKELDALLLAKGINIQEQPETQFHAESSKQARKFGVSGGVAGAVAKVAKNPDNVHPCVINGLGKESIKRLQKIVKTGKCEEGNLIEVMSCEGGCIGGNAVLNTLKIATKKIDDLALQSPDIDKM